jgi:catechol 2,3-dioxygenase-like lactoylglutathione lyase family enzyme
MTEPVPRLDGVHHLKLPVADLDRSIAWYGARLGYRVTVEFVEDGHVAGVTMEHPNGGPVLALRLDPARAQAAAGFDYFALAAPDRAGLEEIAARLTAAGDAHAGVHVATFGWILPGTHDPDGHEVRFYTTEQHTTPPRGEVVRIENPREAAARREAELRAAGALG